MQLKEEELERFQDPAILIHEEGKSFTPEINSRRMKLPCSLCRVYLPNTGFGFARSSTRVFTIVGKEKRLCFHCLGYDYQRKDCRKFQTCAINGSSHVHRRFLLGSEVGENDHRNCLRSPQEK